MNYQSKAFLIFTTLLTFLPIAACNPNPESRLEHPPNSNVRAPFEAPVADAKQAEVQNETEEYKSVYDLFTDEDHLYYKGFQFTKLYRKVRFEDIIEPQPVSYAVLKRGKKVLARFYEDLGLLHATDFGLFSFLGDKTEQAIVGQTAPRRGRFWIINLNSGFHMLFDSADYTTSREEPSIIDIDGDGAYEIIVGSLDFYGIKQYAMLNTPQPTLIFKYNKKAGKYLIANHTLQDYALRGVGDDISKLKPEIGNSEPDKESYFCHTVDILLRYIYAGKQTEGWAFFDREYRLPDKKEVRAKIRAVLRKQGAYRSIYPGSAG